MKVAVMFMLITFLYLFSVTFLELPITGVEHAKTIVPFLLGTIIGNVIGYYWGNSSKNNQGEPPS